MTANRDLLHPKSTTKNEQLFARTQALIVEVCDEARKRLVFAKNRNRYSYSIDDLLPVFPNLPQNLPRAIVALLGKDLKPRDLTSVKKLLLEKNYEYGNSVAEPFTAFSTLTPRERIGVRMDDKLSRLARLEEIDNVTINADTAMDLVGYIVLELVLQRLEAEGLIQGSGAPK